VGVILDESAHAHDAVQRPGRLVAMTRAEFRQPQGQITVAAQALVEDLDVAGAVHRLDRVVAVFGRRGEHVLGIVLPMAGALPERTIHDHRRLHFTVAVAAQHAPQVLFDFLPDRPSLGVPENHPRCFVLQMEEVELPAELAMVALLGLFEHVQIGFLVFLAHPGGAVDPLQLFVAMVAPPVGAGQLHQLEDLELAGRRHVRAAAEIDEITLAVERDLLALRDGVDQLGLVVLSDRLEESHRLVALPDFALDRQITPGKLGHPFLDRRQIIEREWTLVGKIVVEAIFDHRPDRYLRAGNSSLTA
jgi:hypothetical protein